MPKGFAEKIYDFLESYGIDPIYFVTCIMLVVSVSYIRYLDTWDKLPGWKKKIITTMMICTIAFVFISLLKFSFSN